MDPLTHTLCGAALAKTRLGRTCRLAPLILIVGASLPDIDLAWSGFHGSAEYLVHHRGFTHSLLGVVVCAVALAAVGRIIERRWMAGSASLSWRAWLLPALVGVATHPVLDLLNTYGVRPWLPFSSERYYLDLVFILDPWLWIVFGGVAALAGPRSRAGSIVWLLLALGTSIYVLTERRTPAIARWGWPILLASVVALRVAGAGALRPRRVFATGTVVVLLYLGGLEVTARLALKRVNAGGFPVAMRSPIPANPLEWRFFFLEGEDWVRLVDFDLRRGMRNDWRFGPRGLRDPRVLAVQDTPEAAAWRYFARIPWAWFKGSGQSRKVVLDDLRYNWSERVYWTSIEVELPENVQR